MPPNRSEPATDQPARTAELVDPGRSPAIDPGRSPAIDPGRSPAIDPGRSPAIDPGRSPAIDPGRSPAIDPGRSPAIDPRAANALKHGITATHAVVLPGESPADWQQFRSRVIQSLVGDTDEMVLAEVAGRVASCLWRLRRVDVAEASALQSRLAAARGAGVPGYLLEGDVLDRVSRYESHLSREIARAIALLRLLRAKLDALPALEARQAAAAEGGSDADNG